MRLPCRYTGKFKLQYIIYISGTSQDNLWQRTTLIIGNGRILSFVGHQYIHVHLHCTCLYMYIHVHVYTLCACAILWPSWAPGHTKSNQHSVVILRFNPCPQALLHAHASDKSLNLCNVRRGNYINMYVYAYCMLHRFKGHNNCTHGTWE